MELHVIVVVERNAVELEEWICSLGAWSCQSTIQWNTGDVHRPSSADVNALALLDISEVDGIDSVALVRDNRRLHMANQSPLGGAEEGMGLDVRCAGAGTKSSILVLDQKLPDE